MEYFQHLVELITRAEHTATTAGRLHGPPTSALFRFLLEDRIACVTSGCVRYKQGSSNVLGLPIPLDAAVNKQELEEYKVRGTIGWMVYVCISTPASNAPTHPHSPMHTPSSNTPTPSITPPHPLPCTQDRQQKRAKLAESNAAAYISAADSGAGGDGGSGAGGVVVAKVCVTNVCVCCCCMMVLLYDVVMDCCAWFMLLLSYVSNIVVVCLLCRCFVLTMSHAFIHTHMYTPPSPPTTPTNSHTPNTPRNVRSQSYLAYP